MLVSVRRNLSTRSFKDNRFELLVTNDHHAEAAKRLD
jgi:hypothetical protein